MSKCGLHLPPPLNHHHLTQALREQDRRTIHVLVTKANQGVPVLLDQDPQESHHGHTPMLQLRLPPLLEGLPTWRYMGKKERMEERGRAPVGVKGKVGLGGSPTAFAFPLPPIPTTTKPLPAAAESHKALGRAEEATPWSVGVLLSYTISLVLFRYGRQPGTSSALPPLCFFPWQGPSCSVTHSCSPTAARGRRCW